MEQGVAAREPVVSVQNLGKTYRSYARPWHRLLEALTRRRRHQEFHGLEGVSFDLAHGDGIAIVGENGAGKSTLLKILAGVTAPSQGRFAVRGKVASILELGSGFHPDFTGRQNIVLNAAMLGLNAREIEEKTPDIIAFSELGEFIDQPVKTYSTGMAMRLGFAIATQVEPDVLIIDEALSVGDGYFQKKCMDRLQRFIAAGGTLLFCSHAMYFVSAFCQRALWLKGGKVEALGPVDEVVRSYENFLLHKARPESPGADAVEPERPGPVRITAVRLVASRQEGGKPLLRHREPLTVEVAVETQDAGLELHLGVGIDRVDGVQVASFSTFHDGLAPWVGQRHYQARLELPELPLLKGEFALYVFVVDRDALHQYDVRLVQPAFAIETDGFEIGLMKIEHHWRDRASAPPLAAVSSTAGAR
jgi:lipopolysaccharide transport system ATP-binding protein